MKRLPQNCRWLRLNRRRSSRSSSGRISRFCVCESLINPTSIGFSG